MDWLPEISICIIRVDEHFERVDYEDMQQTYVILSVVALPEYQEKQYLS